MLTPPPASIEAPEIVHRDDLQYETYDIQPLWCQCEAWLNQHSKTTGRFMGSAGALEQAMLSAVLKASLQAGLEVDFVLVGGSFAEGLASSTSDIDLILVHAEARPPGVLILKVEGKRVEVTTFSSEDYAKTTRLERQTLTAATAYWRLDARRKLLFSRPIYGHAQHAAQFKNARLSEFMEDLLEFQRSLLFKSFTDLKSGLVDSATEDDLRIRCRTHLERSVDLLLTSLGDCYFREKWRSMRIQRTLTDERLQLLVDPISALLSGRPLPWGRELFGWLRMSFLCSMLCQYLAAFSDSWPTWFMSADIRELLARPTLDIPIVIAKQGASYLCQTPTTAFQLTPALANAVALSALGLPLDRVSQGVEEHARSEAIRGRTDATSNAVPEQLPGLLHRLGITPSSGYGWMRE